jgi:hypothetical protein
LHGESEIESEKSAEKMKIPYGIKLEEVMDYKKAIVNRATTNRYDESDEN